MSDGSWVLGEAELRPHQSRYWLTPPADDPATFAAEVAAVCEVYAQAPTFHEQGGHVVSTDELTGIQALERVHPMLPMRPGQVERRGHDYRRHGTTDLFAALDAKAGTVIGTCRRRHRAQEFRAFLDLIEASVPPDLDVHLVLDNASTHKTKLIRD